MTGQIFTIYDRTGAWMSGYNKTNHYYFASLPADETNINQYLPVPE
jgi:hypothetical protein